MRLTTLKAEVYYIGDYDE